METKADRNGGPPGWITCTICLNPNWKEALELVTHNAPPDPTQPRKHHSAIHTLRWKQLHLDSVAFGTRLRQQQASINLLRGRLEAYKASESPIPIELATSITKQQKAHDEQEQDLETLPESASIDFSARYRDCLRYIEELDRRIEGYKSHEVPRELLEEHLRTGYEANKAQLNDAERKARMEPLSNSLDVEIAKTLSATRNSLGVFISSTLRKRLNNLLGADARVYAISWRNIPEEARQIYRLAEKAQQLSVSIGGTGVVVGAVTVLAGLSYDLQDAVAKRVGFTLTEYQDLGKRGTGEVAEVGDSLPYYETS